MLRVLRDDALLVERRCTPGRADDALDLVLTLPGETIVLQGEVHDDDGPVAGVRIDVVRFGAVGTVETDARGRFRIAGLDDRAAYRLRATTSSAEGEVRRAQATSWAFEYPILRLRPPAREGLALVDRQGSQ
jgi:hypothetical protein